MPSLDSVALEVLARVEGELTLAQITRLASRGSRAGLATVIDRLVRDGIVSARPHGHGASYSLNRDHVLAGAVLSAAAASGEVIQRLRAALEQMSPRPLHATVFGSFARGEGGPLSDIDIAVVMPDAADSEETERALDSVRDAALRWTGNRLEVLLLTPSRIASAPDERVLRDIAEHGIAVLGESWSAVMGGAR